MEEVIDKLIEEIELMNETPESEGGLQGILGLRNVVWDDPGLVLTDEYPYAFVSPIGDEPQMETMGRAGADMRRNFISVVFVIDQSDYFDPTVSEVAGSRELVKASRKLRKWLRRLGKRRLDGLARGLIVQSTNYVPDVRGDAFVRSAVTTLIVDTQDQHEE